MPELLIFFVFFSIQNSSLTCHICRILFSASSIMQMAPHIARSLAGEDPFGKFEHMIKESSEKFWQNSFAIVLESMSLLSLLIKICGCIGNNISMNYLVGV